MDIQKKQVSVVMPVADFDTSVIVESDAIVNDSKPDLLKILQIEPAVRISRSDISKGKITLSGHISYKILYQPENADGVCSILTGTDFVHTEENSDFSDEMYADISADAEHIEPELINSRKIKVKSVISLRINVRKDCSITLPLDLTGDNLQIKYGKFGGFSKILNKRDIITVSDSLSLPAGKPDIGTLLKTDTSLCNKDIKIIAGKVIIKGEVRFCTLYLPEGSPIPEHCSHTLPFTEILDAEGITEDCLCRVKTEIEECDFSLASDSDGDIRVINSNIRIGVKISADMPISEKIVTDVYSLTDNLNISRTPITAKTPVTISDFDHTLNCSVRPDISHTVQSVYNMTANPVITGMTPADGKVMMEGYIDLSYLCITADAGCPLAACSDQVPFRTELNVEKSRSDTDLSCETEVNIINYELGLSGGIDVRIVLSCHIQLCETAEIDIPDNIESAGVAERKAPSIVLCFVQSNDTLWDIAKRYHTKEEYIRELNGEMCDNLTPGQQILIPRG